MKRDPADNLPVTGSASSSELGVRPEVDITVDAAGNVVLDASGMSPPSFRLVARGLLELHRLIKEGQDDSPAAESVRDAMGAPMKALNETEKKRAQWLSEDLYSISEPPASATRKAMNSQAQQQLNEAVEARQGREWDRALLLLRAAEEQIAPALLSYLRGSIWLAAGYAEVAAFFFEHAAENDSENANYRAIYLSSLAESAPDAALNLAKEILADDEDCAPVVVARAVEIRLDEARSALDAESAQLRRELIPILERTMARIEQDASTASRKSTYAMTTGLLGFCHEFLGNVGAAVSFYSRGLQVNPNSDGLLVARGILQYGSSPRAITDFEQAVELGSPVVWPYLFLAHNCLSTNQFERCRFLCETGLRMRGTDAAKSQLEEWRAIAQAELDFPPEAVRAAFEAAVRFDPANESVKRNQDAFDAALGVPRTFPRSNWEQKSQAALRQFGLAERQYSGLAERWHSLAA